jgi:hypothetical protein
MNRQYKGKWGAVNQRELQTIQWQMRSSKSERWRDNTMTKEEPDLLLLICHCIVCPSLRFTAPRLSLYCLSFSPIYCSSFAIVLSVHLSDLLLLFCHCIVSPSLRFTAPHLSLYCLYRQYNDKWGAVNRRDGQTIQWQMRSSKSERWIDNTMTNEEQ